MRIPYNFFHLFSQNSYKVLTLMPFSTLKCEECKELAFHMRLGRRLYHILMLVAVQQKQKQGFSPCNI